jgi:anti-sigma B factor antagonist
VHVSDPEPTRVDVAGELDIAGAPRLARALALTDSHHLVILDLRELSFLDSSGVHVIVGASTRAQEAGRWLIVIRGCFQVNRMLRLTGALDVLNVLDLDIVEPSGEQPRSRQVGPDHTA